MPVPELAVVHPLVLLSVVDHYNRVARDTRKRVIGVLLGEASKGRVDITNSFAVPYEEDERDHSIWFLDHSYLENMSRMFKKVNARERIVGWYSTGPRLREADLDITELLANYCETPLLVICEVQPKDMGLPTTAYYSTDAIREDGTQKSQKVFANIPTEVGATEAEEIGVEHLLRDVKDASVSTLAAEVGTLAAGLAGLKSRLLQVQEYLALITAGRLPMNHDILYQLQDVFNLLPTLGVEELSRGFAVQSNDMMLAIYLASLTRSVLALHNLIGNKEQRLWQEMGQGKAANEKTALKGPDLGSDAPSGGGASGSGKEGSEANGSPDADSAPHEPKDAANGH